MHIRELKEGDSLKNGFYAYPHLSGGITGGVLFRLGNNKLSFVLSFCCIGDFLVIGVYCLRVHPKPQEKRFLIERHWFITTSTAADAVWRMVP